MDIQSVNTASGTRQSTQTPSDDIAVERKAKDNNNDTAAAVAENKKVQPEELLKQIKGLTENGAYSVRFENDEATNRLVVKIVNPKTNEVIRQVPAEEILNLEKRLDELHGNIVDTAS